MQKLYREGEEIKDTLNVGDIIEIYSGVFIRIKEIQKKIVEDLAGIKKTSLSVKSEIIANVSNRGPKSKKDSILSIDMEKFL
jgi:preprotein translocase subunit YajC